MEQTLISKTDLAKRWSVTITHISSLETKGVLTRTEVGKCMYPMEEVLQVERSGKAINLEQENFRLRQENASLRDNVRRLKGVIKGITQTF